MNVLELANSRVVLKRASMSKGGEWHGPCPDCGGDDRFHVWPEQNDGEGSFWCRGCGKHGDAIQFLRDFNGMSFQDACDYLHKPRANKLRIGQPKHEKRWEPKMNELPADPWSEHARAFVYWAYEKLFQVPAQIKYLAARGIPEETLGRYGLGWNPGENGKDLYRNREAWGLPKELNEKGKVKPLWLPIGFVIPNFAAGVVSRVRIRRHGELSFGGRYYVVPGSSMGTMVLEPQSRAFAVVESELDAVTIAAQAGDICGAIALGSASTKPDVAATEILRGAVRVLNALDFDQAGLDATRWWDKEFPDSKRWPVPKGKDIGEAFQQGVDIKAWIMAGLPPVLRV